MSNAKTVRQSNNTVTVIFNAEKMLKAGVEAHLPLDGSLELTLPAMTEEQQGYLNNVWAGLRHELVDIGIHPSVIESTVTTTIDTLHKEINARIIADLI